VTCCSAANLIARFFGALLLCHCPAKVVRTRFKAAALLLPCLSYSMQDGGTKEVMFDLTKALKQEFAVPAVVHFYAWLLAGYSKGNSDALNHAVVSFLWRLVLPEHLNLEPLLYQVGLVFCYMISLHCHFSYSQKCCI
jgi:hypothetical protein